MDTSIKVYSLSYCIHLLVPFVPLIMAIIINARTNFPSPLTTPTSTANQAATATNGDYPNTCIQSNLPTMTKYRYLE